MLCVKPFVSRFSSVPFGCSQCLPCRINRRRQWSFRMLLESMKHGDSSFITLTYADPPDPSKHVCRVCKGPCKKCSCKDHGPSLSPADGRNFLKRLRKVLEPQKIRYFLVGEYGSETQRPHFHLIVFGLSPVIAGGLDGYSGIVRDTWRCGHIYVGDATVDSMQYVAGYVTKKLTNGKDERVKEVLNGRHPEFARMSLRPGVGAFALDDIARAVDTDAGLSELIESGDVPCSLKLGNKSFPLARYMRRKLRGKLGLSEEAPEKAQRTYALKMSDVFKEALASPKMMARCVSASQLWGRINSQRALNLGAKFKIFESAHKI